MSSENPDEPLPPHAYVPGGPWPHPVSSPSGHSHGRPHPKIAPIVGNAWNESPMFKRGVALFNAGYYWEAHEAWEYLWHAHGRKGVQAEMLKALIKLAAAGVKAREGQVHGVRIHAGRAAAIFRDLRSADRSRIFGLELDLLAGFAESLAENPEVEPGPRTAVVYRVLSFQLEPE